MPLEELKEVKAAEMGKLYMNPVVFPFLGLQGKPVSL
jgi:hypothetical protein